jgi:hypothetical protein
VGCESNIGFVLSTIIRAIFLLISTYTEKQTTVHDNDIVTIVATDLAGNKTEQLITVSVKAVGLSISVVCPFYAISNIFICIATIKVGYLSVINSSCNGGVDISINCRQAIRQSNLLLYR